MVHDGLYWRSAVTAGDVARVRSLVASTGFFNAAEVEVATGLIADRLTKGLRSGYHFILAERGETLVGYACYGPIHETRNSFELFWIAVAPEEQGRGLGAEVYARAEAAMAEAGAIRIYADTSSRTAMPARATSTSGWASARALGFRTSMRRATARSSS